MSYVTAAWHIEIAAATYSFPSHYYYCYPRRARSALGVDIVLTLDVCLYVCMLPL